VDRHGQKRDSHITGIRKKFISRSVCNVEKILKGGLDSIPSPSVKIQIIGGKVFLTFKGKTLMGGIVNKQKVC
jgi:hypothetical protein